MPLTTIPPSVFVITDLDNPIDVKENGAVEALEKLVLDMDRFAKQLEQITGLELERGDE